MTDSETSDRGALNFTDLHDGLDAAQVGVNTALSWVYDARRRFARHGQRPPAWLNSLEGDVERALTTLAQVRNREEPSG